MYLSVEENCHTWQVLAYCSTWRNIPKLSFVGCQVVFKWSSEEEKYMLYISFALFAVLLFWSLIFLIYVNISRVISNHNVLGPQFLPSLVLLRSRITHTPCVLLWISGCKSNKWINRSKTLWGILSIFLFIILPCLVYLPISFTSMDISLRSVSFSFCGNSRDYSIACKYNRLWLFIACNSIHIYF